MLKAYVAAQARLADIKTRLSNLKKDESGAALVEYALLVGLMAAAGVAAINALTPHLNSAFTAIGTHLGTVS